MTAISNKMSKLALVKYVEELLGEKALLIKDLEDERVLRQHNKTALTRIIDKRDDEIQLLEKEIGQFQKLLEQDQAEIQRLKAAAGAKNPQVDKLVQGGRDPVVIHTDLAAVQKGMAWALKVVKFQSTVDPEFWSNFVVSINKEGRWFAFLPLKESGETKQFAKEFVTAARAAGFEKANYKQGGGAWFIY